jgi:biopolymer transport protein ExbD
MSEVQVKDAGGGGKNKQKKQTLRVDFTPMVDMNMLLITFFMFCTTLLKPQTMNINMPSKDKPEEGMENKVRETTAITVLLGSDNQVFYYLGGATTESYDDPEFLTTTSYDVDGLRQLLLEKNKGTFEEIEALKIQKQKNEISEEEYNQKTKEIQEFALKEKKTAPSVMIKPSDLATYKNAVDVLDEMLVCNIGFYSLLDIEDGDRHLLYKKTGNPEYLTEKQLQELASNVK